MSYFINGTDIFFILMFSFTRKSMLFFQSPDGRYSQQEKTEQQLPWLLIKFQFNLQNNISTSVH